MEILIWIQIKKISGPILEKQILTESSQYLDEITAYIQGENPNYEFLYMETHSIPWRPRAWVYFVLGWVFVCVSCTQRYSFIHILRNNNWFV